VPPPPAARLVSLFPSKFSTLLLAADKTGLSGEKHAETTGLTVFAPTNRAFQKLGVAANAFLFNTEKGIKYLKALLLYHMVADETLYTDEYYGRQAADGNDGDDVHDEGSTFHVDLPSLLHEKSIGVDIARRFGFVTMRVNGFTDVSTQDVVAKDGVVQVLHSVLIPPHSHKGAWAEEDGEIEVEDLMERLDPFLASEGVGEL
jgi:uncharacterized surface protein with fasciclin (FAS1) repeats